MNNNRISSNSGPQNTHLNNVNEVGNANANNAVDAGEVRDNAPVDQVDLANKGTDKARPRAALNKPMRTLGQRLTRAAVIGLTAATLIGGGLALNNQLQGPPVQEPGIVQPVGTEQLQDTKVPLPANQLPGSGEIPTKTDSSGTQGTTLPGTEGIPSGVPSEEVHNPEHDALHRDDDPGATQVINPPVNPADRNTLNNGVKFDSLSIQGARFNFNNANKTDGNGSN